MKNKRLDVCGGKLIGVKENDNRVRLGPTVRIKDGTLEVLKEAKLASNLNQCMCEFCGNTRTRNQMPELAEEVE